MRIATPSFSVGWCVAGVAMSMTLYDPAFATLGQTDRRALSTRAHRAHADCRFLQHGVLAADPCVGAQHRLAQHAADLRRTLHLVVALPLIAAFVPRPCAALRGAAHREARRPSRRVAQTGDKSWLAACFALAAFVFSSMSAHLVGVLRAQRTLDRRRRSACWPLIGPMQVTAGACRNVVRRALLGRCGRRASR